MADPAAPPPKPIVWWWRILVLLVVGLFIVGSYRLARRFTRDRPVTYENPEEFFKYGSLGGERESGIPYWIWKVLPKVFPEYLPDKKYVPGREYASLGFLYEPGKQLPVGVSQRNTQGINRVFLNCAICHTGTVRESAPGPRTIYTGMPSNTVDLQGFQRFIFACASDARFNSDRLLAEMEALGANYDLLNRTIMRYYAIPFMRERLLMLKDRFRFIHWEPDQGPGRTDTFNPAKTLVNYPLEKMETREIVGICDLPSIWLQGPRRDRDMELHWDGNQRKMEERNKNASFGTGAFPPTIDLHGLGRIEQWLLDLEPPKYPFPINEPLRAQGEKVYAEYCADCHGKNGRDFAGRWVGGVTPIAQVGTDRHRLDSFTPELAATLSTIYTGYPGRFSHFRKTFGYANSPLDGIWLRAPYLHNGSVPTLRDLLNPSAQRPPVFYRGYDVFDQKNVGFVAQAERFTADGRSLDDPSDEKHYFRFDTRENQEGMTPRGRNEGNSNRGHEGLAYGTALLETEKDALVEYLKTF
ncbi:MAG: cytochrome c [Chthoniobacterales bacterium]|nr:cytochrome c [Chthoniobacterales bacterium]